MLEPTIHIGSDGLAKVSTASGSHFRFDSIEPEKASDS
jgi:hypothetical protein